MELLEVNHLCKTYGSGETAVHALKDVSFSVPKGEYVAVVGESGSGKSTLLNLIGGLDTPTSGKVLIDGKEWVSGLFYYIVFFSPCWHWQAYCCSTSSLSALIFGSSFCLVLLPKIISFQRSASIFPAP